ncbi:MAG TPA: hypothetical protein VGC32_21995 [Solirubrobacterales bacterium]
MSASTLGILIVAISAFWLLGGVLLRFAGILMGLAGGLLLAATGDEYALWLLIAGACVWLAGRLHYRLRHRA